ncbi:MAG: hypothetical protein F7C08_00915 [Desulfurococcales archaeon]|nr:hypothetical protein [Desulfurococcales archaeon]MCE4605082.1 hypothetical protein [Desulfurococcales archaeon]
MSLRGVETLLVERILTAMGLDPVEPQNRGPTGDPIVWALWKVLEARRKSGPDRSQEVSSVISWAVGLLPRKEVEKSLRTPLIPVSMGSTSIFSLAILLRSYITKPSLESLMDIAWSIRAELNKPCSSDLTAMAERDRLERLMAKLGLVIGILFSAFFVASILLASSIAIVSVMIIIMGLVWYMVRSYGMRYARLNAELAWAECSIQDPEDLARLILGYAPMQLFADLLSDTGSQRQ